MEGAELAMRHAVFTCTEPTGCGRRSRYVVQQRFREMVIRLITDELPESTGSFVRGAAACWLADAFVELLIWWIEQRTPLLPKELAALFNELSRHWSSVAYLPDCVDGHRSLCRAGMRGIHHSGFGLTSCAERGDRHATFGPRDRPNSHDTPPPRTTAVKVCPSRCSITGFHGTRLKPMPSSIMAKRPLAS